MNITRIRRFFLMIVTALEGERLPASSPVSVERRVPLESADPEAGVARIPWTTEMASPSFMILSARPPLR
ncbi:hypothetical protein [Streptomyces sp. NPDC059874]|uniref:hypothetical protein n=1 Tax=Streptomyces sp. NPDC059874 TaxID=3346983 RepID=UPI003651A9F7